MKPLSSRANATPEILVNLAAAFVFMLLVCCGSALADHKAGANWSWHVISGGFDESRVAVYNKQILIGIFKFSCDLSGAKAGDVPNSDASLNLVKTDSHADGLLVVTCNQGAHSQYLAIIDPAFNTGQPLFARTGSYFVNWELEQGLWPLICCGPWSPWASCPNDTISSN